MVKKRKVNLNSRYSSSNIIFAKCKNGNLIDIDTNDEIAIEDGAIVQVIVEDYQIPEDQLDFHKKSTSRVYGNDIILCFDLKGFRYEVKTKGEMIITRKGNKFPKINVQSCCVVSRKDINTKNSSEEPIEEIVANSLNEVYRKVSERYNTDSSHSCNIYREFKEKTSNRSLNAIRGLPDF